MLSPFTRIRVHRSRSLSCAATLPPVSLSRAVSQPCLILAICLKYRLPDCFPRNSRCLEIRLRDLHFDKCPGKSYWRAGSRSLPPGFPRSPHFFPEGTSPWGMSQVRNSGLVSFSCARFFSSPAAVAQRPDAPGLAGLTGNLASSQAAPSSEHSAASCPL